jgi:hypothetical protein
LRPSLTVPRPTILELCSALRTPPTRHNVRAAASGFEGFINQLSVAIKNSPLNQGKKALAIAQAGDYDVEATKALMDKYIADNDVGVTFKTTRSRDVLMLLPYYRRWWCSAGRHAHSVSRPRAC